MWTWFSPSWRRFRYDRKCLFSCIYNPQITISSTPLFSANFNGNRVKNHPKPWTCPLKDCFSDLFLLYLLFFNPKRTHRDCLDEVNGSHSHDDVRLKGQVQGWGWFLTRFPLKFAENNDVGEIAIWHAFSAVLKVSPWRWKWCAHMRTTSLWEVAAKRLVATG